MTVQVLLDSLSSLIDSEIEKYSDKYLTSTLLENIEKLRKHFEENEENGNKFLNIFVNKFKQNLKNLLRDLQDFLNRLNKTSVDLQKVFNTKQAFSFELRAFADEEGGFTLNKNHNIKLVLYFIRHYIDIQNRVPKEKNIFNVTETNLIIELISLSEKYNKEKIKVSMREEIITQIKLKNNLFNEVSDIDQIVKFIQTSGSDKSRKNKKKKTKKKRNNNNKNKQNDEEDDNIEIVIDNVINEDPAFVDFERKLKLDTKHSNQIEKIKPTYSKDFLAQLRFLLEVK